MLLVKNHTVLPHIAVDTSAMNGTTFNSASSDRWCARKLRYQMAGSHFQSTERVIDPLKGKSNGA